MAYINSSKPKTIVIRKVLEKGLHCRTTNAKMVLHKGTESKGHRSLSGFQRFLWAHELTREQGHETRPPDIARSIERLLLLTASFSSPPLSCCSILQSFLLFLFSVLFILTVGTVLARAGLHHFTRFPVQSPVPSR